MILDMVHLIAIFIAVLTTLSVSVLFYDIYKVESAIQVPWRAIGFGMLACSLLLTLTQTPFLMGVALFSEALGYIAIYRGIVFDPFVSYLHKVTLPEFDRAVTEGISRNRKAGWANRAFMQFADSQDRDAVAIMILGCLGLLGLVLMMIQFSAWLWLVHVLVLMVSLIYIGRIMYLQMYRLQNEDMSPQVRMNNTYALIAFCFLMGRAIGLIAREVTIWGDSWALLYIDSAALIGSMAFIILWIWPFIRNRQVVLRHVVAVWILALSFSYFLWIVQLSLSLGATLKDF